MSRRKLLLWLLVLPLCAGQRKSRQPKGPEIEVLEFAARRTTQGTIEIDGRVRNCGERPLQRVTLVFPLLAPGGEVVTTQNGKLEADVLSPGEEAEFHWKMRDHVRAVSLRVAARDRGENQLLVEKAGPYPIE